MEKIFELLKQKLNGTWKGEGYAHYPTIVDTGYTEEWIFESDKFKPTIHYHQKTWYKNDSPQNGQTVFWDAGFILLKDDTILWVSSQAGGRQETCQLTDAESSYVFQSLSFANDPRMVRSERILTVAGSSLTYELNMETRENGKFENHLRAQLTREAN